ncbi:hypothetical protein AB8613_23495 [Vibrio sp. BS-M-Sm-2]|uniref:hypothetical protein n=1 Tax=Vibrio sp. BS-M-Sm-2 TaxID=3241167 RepID=UPI00355855A5
MKLNSSDITLERMYQALMVVNYFHEDVSISRDLLDQSDTQFNRRQYVRVAFAAFESSLYQYKKMYLELQSLDEFCSFSREEIAYLKDKEIRLGESGKFEEKNARIPLKPNVKCFIELTKKLFGNQIDPMKDQYGWQSFIRSIEVRNKLMHPKEPKEFEVTDEQLSDIKSAFKWFIDSVHSSTLFGFLDRCELKLV